MPALPIFASDGSLFADAYDRLLAIMHEPNDEVARKWVYGALQQAGAHHDPTAELQGQLAGDLLVLVEHLARHEGRRRASLKLAMHLYGKEHVCRRDARGKPMPTSETNLKRVWKKYRAAAHLWAGWRRLVRSPTRFGGVEGKISPVTLLIIAEHYRKFGEQHRVLIWNSTARVGEPLLDRRRLWRLPPHIDIPRISPSLLATEPGTRYEEFLADLKPSKRRAKPN